MACNNFENLNGILKNYFQTKRYPELPICSAVSTYLSLDELKRKNYDNKIVILTLSVTPFMLVDTKHKMPCHTIKPVTKPFSRPY